MQRITPLIFNVNVQAVRADVHTMKQRTEKHLRQHGRAWGEVKLGEGSIRDVEFVTQYLQLAYGARAPQIRSHNTLNALDRASAHELLPMADYRVLREGYIFLRTVEHYLQMMHYRQTHALPEDAEAFAQLARRLGFQGTDAGSQFLARYEQHRIAIRAVYMQYLGRQDVMGESEQNPPISASSAHIARMDPTYTTIFTSEEIRLHTALIEQLDHEHPVRTHTLRLDDGNWRVTIVGYDYPGELSIICGLLFVYGLTIERGHVFTYEPEQPATSYPSIQPERQPQEDITTSRVKTTQRKIVDVFTVRPVVENFTLATWAEYTHDLIALLQMMRSGKRREARGLLAKRVADALPEMKEVTTALYPIEIEIDNNVSDLYTVLRIDTPDTIGFLYEFANALAYSRIYIARVIVNSVGNRVYDTLYVTDANGRKITDPDKQRELRAATVVIKHFTHLLPHSPNPGTALLHFREFIAQLFQRPDWPNEFASLERPEVLNALARLLGVSEFLWDDFLRMQHANLFPVVQDVDALESAKSKAQLRQR